MTDNTENPSPTVSATGASGSSSEPDAYQTQEQTPAGGSPVESASGHTASEAWRVGRKSSSSEVRR